MKRWPFMIGTGALFMGICVYLIITKPIHSSVPYMNGLLSALMFFASLGFFTYGTIMLREGKRGKYD